MTCAFGQRLLFLPGTHLGAVLRPSNRLQEPIPPLALLVAGAVRGLPGGRRTPGAGQRSHTGGRFNGPPTSAGKLASRLVTGIRLRNVLTFVNSYYDDMAWLALATLRLENAEAEETAGQPGSRRNARVRKR